MNSAYSVPRNRKEELLITAQTRRPHMKTTHTKIPLRCVVYQHLERYLHSIFEQPTLRLLVVGCTP